MKKLIYIFLIYSGYSYSNALSPPEYEIIDRNKVNMASGHVSPTEVDLKIGDSDLGLTHTISTYSSNFGHYAPGKWGYQDKYQGLLYSYEFYRKNKAVWNPSTDIVAIKASGLGSYDFLINGDGTYTAIRDNRITLEFVYGKGYVLIDAEGNRITYTTDRIPVLENPYNDKNRAHGLRVPMKKIEMANGFTININTSRWDGSPYSVITNTGYQLKYIYVINNNPIDPDKADAESDPMIPAMSANWSSNLPKYIKAINRKYEYCSEFKNINCELELEWPTVTYNWPDGMPRAFYIGDSIFSIEKASGQIVEYHHRAIDRSIEPGHLIPNTYFMPRLIKIVHPQSNNTIINYEYENKGTLDDSSQFYSIWQSSGDAVLKRAYTDSWSQGYAIGIPHIQHGTLIKTINGSGGYKAINHVYFQNYYQAVTEVDLWDKILLFDTNYANRLNKSIRKFGNGTVSYKYDARGNVIEISDNGIITKAEYDSVCINRKTCNKARWISDGNGHKTYYTYHDESGLVSTVTLPRNKKGISPQTRYEYTKKYAKFKLNSNVIEYSPDGVWLLSSESYCLNSSYSNNACVNNDEVVIKYEYDENNMNLISKVETYKTTVKRFCYKYDRFGNQVSEMLPNTQLNSCI